jgi:AbrB family looped-hinge helix DNA binding protein
MVAATNDMLTMTLSSKGQVVIPKAVRDRLGLRAGDVLEIEEQGGALLLRVRHESPAALRERLFGPPVPLESLVGMFADRVPPGMRGLSMAEMRRVAQADFAQRWRAKEEATKADDDHDDVIDEGDEP